MRLKFLIILVFLVTVFLGKSQITGRAWKVIDVYQKDNNQRYSELYGGATIRFGKKNKLVLIKNDKKFNGTYSMIGDSAVVLVFNITISETLNFVENSFLIQFLDKKSIVLSTDKDLESGYIKLRR